MWFLWHFSEKKIEFLGVLFFGFICVWNFTKFASKQVICPLNNVPDKFSKWRHGGNLDFFFENENNIKSLGTSIYTYILNFVNFRPFLTKLECWRETRFAYDVIAPILTSNLKRETPQPKRKPYVSTTCIYHLGWPNKNEKKKTSKAIHVLVPLVKFGDDSTYSFWVKCVMEGRTDRQRVITITLLVFEQ